MDGNSERPVTNSELADALRLLLERGPIGIVRLADEMGCPHDHARTVLRTLDEERLVEQSSAGAVPTDRAESFERLLDTFHVSLDEFVGHLADREDAAFEQVELTVEQRDGEWTATVDDRRRRGCREQATGQSRREVIEAVLSGGRE